MSTSDTYLLTAYQSLSRIFIYGRSREIFLTIIFFFWKFYHVRNVKNWGVTDFVFERIWPEEHLNLSKSKKTTMAASHKILQLELWREMFSAKYGWNGPIKRI